MMEQRYITNHSNGLSLNLPHNNVMHAKPDLRVFLKWMIAGSGSVITDVIPLANGLPSVTENNPYLPPAGTSEAGLESRDHSHWSASRSFAALFAVLLFASSFVGFIYWALTFYYAIRPPAPDWLIYFAHVLLANLLVTGSLAIYWLAGACRFLTPRSRMTNYALVSLSTVMVGLVEQK